MKYIKSFELKTSFIPDLFSQPRFNVGDIVRTKDNTGLFEEELKPGHNYFKIISIDFTQNDGYNFLLHNIVSPDDMDFYDKQDDLELVSDYEFTGLKYNL